MPEPETGLTKMRLVAGEHYVFNEGKSIVTWCTGSTTQFDYLAYQPSDPNYSRLGGRAYTRAGIDEANEVEELAADSVSSRLRYRLTDFCHACAAQEMAMRSKVVDVDEETGLPILWECYRCKTWTKGLLPKLLLTGNPGEYWTKYRYVFTKDGEPVQLSQRFRGGQVARHILDEQARRGIDRQVRDHSGISGGIGLRTRRSSPATASSSRRSTTSTSARACSTGIG